MMFHQLDLGKYTLPPITKISIHMTHVRFREDFTISGGSPGGAFQPILIRVHGEDGITGVASLDNFPGSTYDAHGTSISWVHLVEEYVPKLASYINGARDVTVFDIHEMLHGTRGANPFVTSSLEMAFWDLLGRHARKPCHELFREVFSAIIASHGGNMPASSEEMVEKRLRSGLPSKISIGIKDRYYKYDSIILNGVQKGINTFKLKITPESRYNTGLLEYITSSFPDIKIDTDANASFTPQVGLMGKLDVEDMKKIYVHMESFNIRMHEQPSISDGPHWQILEELQDGLTTPMCPDESIHGLHDVQQLCKMARETGKMHYMNLKIHRTGGILNCIKALAITCLHGALNLEARVIPWGGYMPDQPISTNALLHLFTCPVETCETDATDHDYWFTDTFCNERHEVTGGHVKIIKGDGLGVSIKLDKLHRIQLKRKVFKDFS
ncbi:hypothetical protein GF325_02705 [Candidatus Bathyarchaeota archaeon]|nr:hypothetical protein [Candidatus Bathyarchaeota archaeon]